MKVDTRCGPGKRADCRDAVKVLSIKTRLQFQRTVKAIFLLINHGEVFRRVVRCCSNEARNLKDGPQNWFE